MDIKYSKQAYKYLSKLHKPKAEQIKAAINKLPTNEKEIRKYITKLRGIENLYRLRVNDYRVIYSKEYDIIKIEKIKSRGDVYGGK